jgi:hypothetical protein
MSIFTTLVEWFDHIFHNDNFYDSQLRKYLDNHAPKDTAEVERLIREYYLAMEKLS